MPKRILGIAAVLAVALTTFSCVSTKYYGPADYVAFRSDDKVKTGMQASALQEGTGPLTGTYDDEYVYDDKGNVIKIKQTEYIDLLAKDKKFIVWETESKIIGGNPVPYRVSANGVPFLEVEYELLPAQNAAEVTEDVFKRNFRRVTSSFMKATDYENWSISIENYDVPFKADKKFVQEARRFNPYVGEYYENVLTLGYGNIVLKRFHYSREQLAEGVAKSYTGFNYQSEMAKKLALGVNVDYTYEWKAIADRICQTKMTYSSMTLKFEAVEEYSSSGKRIKETWTVTDPREKTPVPKVIFEQNLTY
jgi:hypothetical protein